MLWLICILCQKLMEFFMVHSEILEASDLIWCLYNRHEFFRLIDGKLDVIPNGFLSCF